MPRMNPYNYQKTHDDKLAQSICVSATVKVIAFDSAKMTVDVQPLSKHLENGNYESQPPILGVPVAVTRSGTFIIRPWFNIGDVGAVVYLDHDMDSTVTGGKEAEPLTERNHESTDAVFIGGIVSGNYSSTDLPEDSLTLATEDSRIYVSLTQERVTIKNEDTIAYFTNNEINMTTGEVNITASGAINIQGKVVNIN